MTGDQSLRSTLSVTEEGSECLEDDAKRNLEYEEGVIEEEEEKVVEDEE